jgi:hypothetical protein
MKNLAVLALAVAFLLTTFAFGGSPEYTVKAPAGWEKKTGSSAPEHYMKDGVSLILTIDNAPSEAKTPDAYVEFVKKLYASALKNVKFEPVKKVKINGIDARELCYTGETYGMKMKYDVMFFPKQSKYFTITAGGLETSFDTMKADYQGFFNSFKFK